MARASVTNLVPLLERLSLLRINQTVLDRVIRCVEFADKVHEVNTSDNIEPMISPTERQCIKMRDDVTESTDRFVTMKNASKLVEDYFVTPSEHKHYSKL